VKIINIIIISAILLSASVIDDYKHKRYEKICTFTILKKYIKNEKILSIMGDACIKSDNLFMLPFIVHKLKNTPVGRKNSIYLLTIYMQKKLICSFVFDNISLKGFSFPDTDCFISFIFKALQNGRYKKINNKFIIYNKPENITYYIYKKDNRIYVETYKNKKLIKRRYYR